MLDSIEVFLRKIKYHESSDHSGTGIPFLIATAMKSDASGDVTIKGEMYSPKIGEQYRLYGEWREEPKFGGKSFNFCSFQISNNDTIEGLTDYLARYVSGLGKIRARQVASYFGPKNCLKILREDPSRIMEIEGIGKETVSEVQRHFKEDVCGIDPASYAALYDIVVEKTDDKKKMPAQRIITSILRDFGSSAPSIIRENPYILLNYAGLGWDKVDRIAVKKIKYDPKGIDRHRAAILEMLKRIADDGDTYADLISLRSKISNVFKFIPSQESIDSLALDGSIIIDSVEEKGRPRTTVSLRHLFEYEQEIAWRLKEIYKSFNPADALIEFDTEGLEEEQIEACKFIAKNPVCCLVGPPGTGKTTTITKILKTLEKFGHTIIFTAPTGKAAKRADEVLTLWIPNHRIQVSTIHRALEPTLSGEAPVGVPEEHAKFGRDRKRFAFQRNEFNVLEMNDGVTDEHSMVDVELFVQYLRAVPPGSRLIFSGDENQLPSVGPGACLRDMIRGGIPTFSLEKPRRNSGRIVLECHQIYRGIVPECPDPDKFDPESGENRLHIEESDPHKIAQIIVDLHDNTDRDPLWDLQVISPQNDSNLPIACENLNRLLSRKLNPARHRGAGDQGRYGIGDKVVRTKNGAVVTLIPSGMSSAIDDSDDWDDTSTVQWGDRVYFAEKTYIVNGDIGQIVDICKIGNSKSVIVRFRNPDRICVLPASEAYITLAYCTTVHKAQGSGFPVVIFPVHNSFYWNDRDRTGLWHRELYYTMESRGIDVVITVGKYSAVSDAIKRKTVDKRKTMLARFLKGGSK